MQVSPIVLAQFSVEIAICEIATLTLRVTRICTYIL
jgi:hypothetical protein